MRSQVAVTSSSGISVHDHGWQANQLIIVGKGRGRQACLATVLTAISSLLLSVSHTYSSLRMSRRLEAWMERQNTAVLTWLKRGAKTLLIAISVLFGASGIGAAESAPGKPAEQGDWPRICATFGKVAEKIMTERQGGISRTQMIQSVRGDSLFEYIVVQAYKVPRISTDRMQKKSIEEFRDRIYLECVNATRLK